MDENFRRVTWLEWPSTHQCTIQKILFRNFMDGMKLFPRGQFTWSAIFIFFWVLFFLLISFSQLTVFSPGPPFWFLFNFGHPWPHIIFWQLLPTSQIYLLPFLLLPCLPPSHLHYAFCFFLPHSLLFCSPPSPVFEKQGQLEHLGLGFICELALGFSFEGFEFPWL